jgi:hypothetical protein
LSEAVYGVPYYSIDWCQNAGLEGICHVWIQLSLVKWLCALFFYNSTSYVLMNLLDAAYDRVPYGAEASLYYRIITRPAKAEAV